MIFENSDICLIAQSETEKRAASIFSLEWQSRLGVLPLISSEKTEKFFIDFVIEAESESEEFSVKLTPDGIVLTAHRFRGLVYACGRLLRKLRVNFGRAEILRDAFGVFGPDMPVRGHSMGYNDMSNTYEAWDEKQFRRYILDLMYFGLNTLETSYSEGNKITGLMRYGFHEAFVMLSRICLDYDIDLTLWYSLKKSKTDEETLADILDIYGGLPKITSFFIPGGDPGDMLPEDFMRRCIKIKNAFADSFPNLKLFPSAQAPHEYPDWRERFTKVMDGCPTEVDGIIYAPNHAMPLDDLRRTIDKRYPLQHYPDLSHNVRCETPVHFPRDDWHFAWAATLSRESVNPRPEEYALLHKRTRQYVEGQISYSEGVHDDVNKIIWSGLDFDFSAEISDILRDYSRLFFFGVDPDEITEGIFGLEQNWLTSPETSAGVEPTYEKFCRLSEKYPELDENWRFNLLLFRATCDKIVRDRRIFELDLIKQAKYEIEDNNLTQAEKILSRAFPEEYTALREGLFPLANRLFHEIGIQLDVKNFSGMSWERGCTLETIDMPVTDRRYLLNKLNSGFNRDELLCLINRGKMQKDEYYFSFAFDGFDVCSPQDGEYYYDFMGDRNPDALIPMCMTKNYDHFNFRTRVAGLTGGDYILRITYKDRNNSGIEHHKVTLNGHCLYDGKGFGGERDFEFEKLLMPHGYQSVVYTVPKNYFVNGCGELEITEPTVGFIISEIYFEKLQKNTKQ